ncbi:ribonuclease H-like [Lineus longissimus]|uniref:ribonuclease H-like n=1 Tax=Lineus longissimus TaxID=88925 RepID=UPI00315CFFD3
MIDRKYPHGTWTHVYTNGSSQNAVSNGGSGVFIKLQDRSSHSISVPSGILCSNYRAEMQVLTIATDYLITTQEDVGDNLVLLTDSLSALQALMAATSDQLTENLLKNLSSLLQDRRVVLQWIPAHVGVPGNERADQFAKEGSKQHQTKTRMTYRESKTLLKTKLKNQWRDDTDGYQPLKDSIHQLDRKGQVSIYRLRTGHCKLHQRLKRLGLHPTASCECGLSDQTPRYILQD